MKKRKKNARLKVDVKTMESGVAFHEAGHAVAAILLKRKFRYVTIIPEEDSLGHVKHYPSRRTEDGSYPRLSYQRCHDYIDLTVMLNLAGSVAQEKGEPKTVKPWHARSDYLVCFDWFRHERFVGLEEYLAYCRARLINMFSFDSTWAGVEAVVDALLKRKKLSYAETTRIFRDAEKKAFNLNRRPIKVTLLD